MMKRAEELATLITEEMRGMFPDGAPQPIVDAGIRSLKHGLKGAIELYGRECLEAAAKSLEVTPSDVRLHAGEMTAAEMRTVQAVLAWRQRVIMKTELP